MQLFNEKGDWTSEAVSLTNSLENLIHDWILNHYENKDFRHLAYIVLESALGATLRARTTIARNKRKPNVPNLALDILQENNETL